MQVHPEPGSSVEVVGQPQGQFRSYRASSLDHRCNAVPRRNRQGRIQLLTRTFLLSRRLRQPVFLPGVDRRADRFQTSYRPLSQAASSPSTLTRTPVLGCTCLSMSSPILQFSQPEFKAVLQVYPKCRASAPKVTVETQGHLSGYVLIALQKCFEIGFREPPEAVANSPVERPISTSSSTRNSPGCIGSMPFLIGPSSILIARLQNISGSPRFPRRAPRLQIHRKQIRHRRFILMLC